MRKMSKRMLQVSSALGLILTTSISQATECTPAPDCASLGYSKTATDCKGVDAIKCPFDTSKLYCQKEETTTPSYDYPCSRENYVIFSAFPGNFIANCAASTIYLQNTGSMQSMWCTKTGRPIVSIPARAGYGDTSACNRAYNYAVQTKIIGCCNGDGNVTHLLPPVDTALATPTMKVGDILYSDKSFSAGVLSGKKAIGVIFDVINRLAVALDQTSLYWSTERVDIPVLGNCSEPFSCSTNGKQNTAAIMEYVKTNGKTGKYPAAEYCTSYKPSTVYQDEVWYAEGQWFLPSMKELQTLYNNKDVVNASLQKVNAVTLSSDYYWSSTEINNNSAWILKMSSGYTYNSSKNIIFRVRPVLAF